MNKIIKAYAHDFRDMAMTEDELEKMLCKFWDETIEYLIKELSKLER